MGPGADVLIIGLGSRGLSVLERVVTLAEHTPVPHSDRGRLRVAVVDPAGTGCGVHRTDQPDYLLLNTRCVQVSMFPDHATVPASTARPGPNLYEWAGAAGIRVSDSGFMTGPTESRPVGPGDFLPRRLLGEYLRWFRDYLLRRAARSVELTVHRTDAVDMRRTPDGLRVVGCADGSTISARTVFLTTGYTPNRDSPACASFDASLITEPYPLPELTSPILPHHAVGVAGFGLAAIDVVTSLTVGRGGRFATDGHRLTYVPSGAEPMVVMFSRSGAPFRVGPRVARDGAADDPAVLFTPEAIDELRLRRGQRRLDFRRDILPLILAEMRITFRRTQARLIGAWDLLSTLDDLAKSPDPGEVVRFLDALGARLGTFDPWAALEGRAGKVHDGSYQRWFAETVHHDLAEGARTLSESPVKQALQVLDDHRDTIRHAVDFGGLTPESHDDFMTTFTQMFSRAVVGPQWERHAELLALMDAGVVRTSLGPAPAVALCERSGRWRIESRTLGTAHVEEVDWLLSARVATPSVESSASPLITAMYRNGWIRPYRPVPGRSWGIDIDANQHPLDINGEADPQVWMLGAICEGATYYTNLVPFPGDFCRPIHDAHRCVTAALERLRSCTHDVPVHHNFVP